MECVRDILRECLSGILDQARNPTRQCLQDSEGAALGAACKLSGNFETVVKDITNQGPNGVKGGNLTQTHLTRLPSDQANAVQAMLKAVSYRLIGKEVTGPSNKEEAKVW